MWWPMYEHQTNTVFSLSFHFYCLNINCVSITVCLHCHQWWLWVNYSLLSLSSIQNGLQILFINVGRGIHSTFSCRVWSLSFFFCKIICYILYIFILHSDIFGPLPSWYWKTYVEISKRCCKIQNFTFNLHKVQTVQD